MKAIMPPAPEESIEDMATNERDNFYDQLASVSESSLC